MSPISKLLTGIVFELIIDFATIIVKPFGVLNCTGGIEMVCTFLQSVKSDTSLGVTPNDNLCHLLSKI